MARGADVRTSHRRRSNGTGGSKALSRGLGDVVKTTWLPLLPYAATLIGIHLLSNAWAAILFYHLGVLAVLLRARRWPVERSNRVGLAAVATIVVCAAAGALLYYLWPVAGKEGLGLGSALADLGLSDASWWAFTVYFVMVHPVLEEALWRGFLRAARRPLLKDLLFGGYHAVVLIVFLKWYFVVLACLAITAAAWQWRRQVDTTGGNTWAIVAHAAADLSVMIAAILLLRPADA
jgi:membrane protease YdiL (CAAX protease family)